MYCKHCGTRIEHGAGFCPKCGESLAESSSGGMGKLQTRFSVPFLLILGVGLVPMLVSLTQRVYSLSQLHAQGEEAVLLWQMSEGMSQWLLSELLPNMICLLAVVVLALFHKIDTNRVSYSSVLETLILVLLSEETLGYGLNRVIGQLSVAAVTSVNVFEGIYAVVALPAVWRWFLLGIYLLGCSGRRMAERKILTGTAVILIVWSGVLYFFSSVFIAPYTSISEVYGCSNHLSKTYYLTMWLNRGILLCFTFMMGGRILKIGGAIACAALKVILTFVFLFPLIFNFRLGIVGLPLSNVIAYIAVGTICLLVYCVRKKRAAA